MILMLIRWRWPTLMRWHSLRLMVIGWRSRWPRQMRSRWPMVIDWRLDSRTRLRTRMRLVKRTRTHWPRTLPTD